MDIIYLALMSICNRIRGSQVFNLVKSTTLGRLIATGFMGLLTGLLAQSILVGLWIFASVYLWTIFAWDGYWSAAIGHGLPTKPVFKPVDWVMSKLPKMPEKMWGGIAMGLRQMLLAPALIGLMYLTNSTDYLYALIPSLFGFVYVLVSFTSTPYVIGWSEYIIGALIGAVFLLIIG